MHKFNWCEAGELGRLRRAAHRIRLRQQHGYFRPAEIPADEYVAFEVLTAAIIQHEQQQNGAGDRRERGGREPGDHED